MKKIAAIVLTFISLFTLTACRVGDISVNFYAPYWKYWEYSSGNEFTYNAAEITEVDINWVGGEIEIVESKNAELTVTENSAELDEGLQMHYLIDDGKLTIHYSKALCREEIDAEKKHLRVEVPEGIKIDIDSVNASIKVGEMTLGEIKLTNVSGNVELMRVVASEVTIENVDGDILAEEIIADKFSATSVSGLLSFLKISANNITVTNVSGKTELGISKKSEVSITGASGNVDLKLHSNIGATVEYSTMSGTFSADMPHTTSGKTYIFGNGEINIRVETASGNLYVS